MSLCYGCSSRFSFLNKEKSCSICRLSFCPHCLKKFQSGYKCDRCVTNASFGPPAVLIQRLQQLDDPSRPPVTMISNRNSRESAINVKGLEPQDVQLLQRLEKLKESSEVVPTEAQIRERLEALKRQHNISDPTSAIPQAPGLPVAPSAEVTPSPFAPRQAALSDQEQVDALLAEYMASAAIDGSMSHPVDSDEDERGSVAAIMRRAMEEAALPEAEDMGGLSPPPSPPAEEELPWCELCNADATLRCMTCDSALYCRRCYRETHTGVDSDHVTQSYP